MPNWCSDTLIVSGPEGDVCRWQEAARAAIEGEKELSLQSLYPMPEDRERQLEEGKDCYLHKCGNGVKYKETYEDKLRDAWYHWHIHHWGTKWDVGEARLNAEPGLLTYDFDTAWSPPVEAFNKIAKDWPELRFELRYCEPGMWFAGIFTWEDGLPVLREEGVPEDFKFCEAWVAQQREYEEEEECQS